MRALDLLATYPNRKIFVFGGMAELGEETKPAHITVAQHAEQLGIDSVLTFGEAARDTQHTLRLGNITKITQHYLQHFYTISNNIRTALS